MSSSVPERGLVDLSHAIENGLITYQGLPAPVITDYLSHRASRTLYSEGTEFHIGKIELVANTGTYIDAPFHRFPGGRGLVDLPLERVADLDGVRIDARQRTERAIGPAVFDGQELSGKAVLVHTGWDGHWGSPSYFEGHPFLSREAAELLSDAGVALVGIDSLNIDDTNDGTRPVHTILLQAEIPIVEHLRGLEELGSGPFRFSAVPVKVRGLGSFPVRAFAMVEGGEHRKPA